METKSIFASKTVWFNIIATAMDILALTEFGAVIPSTWAPYIALIQGIGNIALRRMSSGPVTFTGGSSSLLLAAAIGGALSLSACGGKPVVLVAQTGQTLAGAIGEAQKATTRLMHAGVITPGQARVVHTRLLQANDKLVPLPDLLVAIDAAIKAGQSDEARIAAALAILQAVGVELDQVIAGLPVGDTAADILKATTEARELVAQITEAIARRRSASNPGGSPAVALGGAR